MKNNRSMEVLDVSNPTRDWASGFEQAPAYAAARGEKDWGQLGGSGLDRGQTEHLAEHMGRGGMRAKRQWQ